MGQLCEAYWFPLYVYVRRRGYTSADAKDLVQAFITQLIERNDFRAADPARGKFRTYLLAALSHFLANQHDHETAKKRGGGQSLLSVDWSDAESRYGLEPVDDQTPERIFDRQWALAVLSSVLDQLRESFRAAEKLDQFESLSPYLTGDHAARSYAEIAEISGVSVAAIKTAVHRMRKQYRDLLRQKVAETLPVEDEVDDEIRELLNALRQ